ncbi:MAG: LptF/LptG family permease [Phycisphaerae bacterium]|nr:LptF/LptG family permease [Phycisphaerae bacterium]
MVFTLHRYIFRELFKVFFLAATALMLMVSIGSILRPVQEYGVGPKQVIHLIGYFLPITMTFVLPISALFAASLVYGRFAADNELDACKASGIGMPTLLYPGLILAILVAMANLLLSFYVMPAFVQRAEEALKTDAKQIVFRNIQRNGFYESPDGGYLIYADHVDMERDLLGGVIVTEMDKNKIRRTIAVETAKVTFFSHGNTTEVRISSRNFTQLDNINLGWVSFGSSSIMMEFPSMMGDNIKFKEIDEIQKIEREPVRFAPIAKLNNRLYAQVSTEILAYEIVNSIAADKMYTLNSGIRIIEFIAKNARTAGEGKIELNDIRLIERSADSKELMKTFEAPRAMLALEGREANPVLTMVLYNTRWQKPDGLTSLAGRQTIPGLTIPQSVSERFPNIEPLAAVRRGYNWLANHTQPTAAAQNILADLDKEISNTFINIKAETHSRLVFGSGCIPLIMIGIGLGIIKRGGHLLTAFGVSAIPAALLIVCIMMGKNITKNPGSGVDLGLLLMWSGLAILTVLALGIYHKLVRN